MYAAKISGNYFFLSSGRGVLHSLGNTGSMIDAHCPWYFTGLSSARSGAARRTCSAGTIIVSHVHIEFSASDEPSFCPALEYRFSIMGRKYVGNRIRPFTWSHASHESASKALSDYPVGKAVTVRHHPSRPEDSVLEPGLRHRDIVLSVIYIAVCIYLTAELASQLGFRLP